MTVHLTHFVGLLYTMYSWVLLMYSSLDPRMKKQVQGDQSVPILCAPAV